MSSFNRRWLAPLLLLSITGVLVAEHVEVVDPDPARFEADIQAFEAQDRIYAAPADPILFVGSSSIRLWPTTESFRQLPVINRGFGGSHISDVNYFAERIVVRYRPQIIVFYAGDNDIAAGKPAEQVFADFRAFVRLVREKLPDARIIYLPIKPSLARWEKWPQMQVVNSAVEQLSKMDRQLFYADTATPMLGDDGRPRPELFVDDGLHLSNEGYRLWSRELLPIMRDASTSEN